MKNKETKTINIPKPTDKVDFFNEMFGHFYQNQQPCLHDSCPQCKGTGFKQSGGYCFHMISCPCPKCTPSF